MAWTETDGVTIAWSCTAAWALRMLNRLNAGILLPADRQVVVRLRLIALGAQDGSASETIELRNVWNANSPPIGRIRPRQVVIPTGVASMLARVDRLRSG